MRKLPIKSLIYTDSPNKINPNTKTKCTIEDDEYVLQSPTRTGYTFKRWNTYEEDYESGAISKIPAHSMESYVLYAIWTRNE